jgi:hypothetical protein
MSEERDPIEVLPTNGPSAGSPDTSSNAPTIDSERTFAEVGAIEPFEWNEPQERDLEGAEFEPASSQDGEKFRAWINEFLDWGTEGTIGKLFGAGCDIFFLMEFTYQYCAPDPDPLDEWIRKVRSLRAVLPDYIRKIRKLSKNLKQLETPDRLELLGKDINPQAQQLENYAHRLEGSLREFEEAGTKGSYRPFYLLSMSYYLRAVYPERWRGQWMKKAVHADIRDLVNAGFRTNGIDRDVSEDQIRRLCERFSKSHPTLAEYAEKLSRERPIKCQNVYEKLYQDAFLRVADGSLE